MTRGWRSRTIVSSQAMPNARRCETSFGSHRHADLNAEAGRSNGEAGELIELTGPSPPAASETEPSYFRGKAIFTAPAALAGATHSAVLKVFAVARAAPVCQVPSVRNIFRAHVVVEGLHATCVVAAA